MSSDAVKGSDTPFDKRIQNVRGHGGQIAVAGVLRELMQGSDIRASHRLATGFRTLIPFAASHRSSAPVSMY